MKKIIFLPILFALSACGTLGIGSNHETRLYNNSKDTITVSADSSVYKIKPEQDIVIYSNNDLTIMSSNSVCNEKTVVRELNTHSFSESNHRALEAGVLNDWKNATLETRVAMIEVLTGSDKSADLLVRCVDKMSALPDGGEMKILDAVSLCYTGLSLKRSMAN